MSTKLLATSNLDLLIPSTIQASWHALAFCRTRSVRALGVPRVHVLHVRATEPPRLLPRALAFARLQSHALPSTTRQNTPSRPGALQRRRQGPLGGTPASTVRLCHGRRRPSHSRSPARLWSSPSLSASSSTSARCCHVVLQATERWFADLISARRGTDLDEL